MKLRIVIVTLLFLTTNIGWSQTKEETISYLNSILNLKTSGVEYYSFSDQGDGFLTVNSKAYFTSGPLTLYFKFNPKDALYIDSSNNSKGETDILISFKQNKVMLLYDINGEIIKELSNINIAPLLNMLKNDTDKFIKAYKHLIKLYGGTIKEDPFK